MRLAYMSSVCPKMTLAELLETGRRYGYEGIEFRPEWGHAHGVELAASAEQRREIARQLRDGGLVPCCISPGVKFCHNEQAKRDEEQAKLTQYIEMAAEIGIPHIRVFGDPIPNTGAGTRQRNYKVQSDYLGEAAERAAHAGVQLVLETHMNFRALDADEVLYLAGYPAELWVNWHLGHCLRHGEDVDEAYRHVKGRVGHVHWNIVEEKVERLHLHRQFELLAGEGYDGYCSVEVINPPEPLKVLVEHAEAWQELTV